MISANGVSAPATGLPPAPEIPVRSGTYAWCQTRTSQTHSVVLSADNSKEVKTSTAPVSVEAMN
jgi:hypothetical protein